MDKTNACLICGDQIKSRVKLLEHLKKSHTLGERLNALMVTEQVAEVEYDE